MAIADVLIPELRARFSAHGLRCGSPPDAIAVFPACCEDVGDVLIHDDGDEVTIYIENVTHGHEALYDKEASDQETAQWVTSRVIEFLEQLFADRVLLWVVDGGRSSGWMTGFDGTIPRHIPSSADLYVWSRRL